MYTVRQLKLKKIVAATALALSSAVLWSPAHAAGLGRLNVLSGLGQPLRAEIDLTSVSREEAGSLAARLASPAAYRQAGVEYNATLLSVRMAVDRRPDGQYFIRLTSTQPVNDPIVDALVELTWANGRLLREYTFLLDPVDMKPAPQPAAPVAAPEPKPAPPVAQPAPPPAVATPAPVRPVDQPSVQPSLQPTARPTAQSKPAGVTGSYEVKKGDTLGKIARQAQTDGVTLDQMLVALQRANQEAFIGANVNRLKSGVILSIPDKEAAAAVAPVDARRLIAAQAADWKSYQEKIAGGVQTAPAPKPAAARQEAKGKITARVEDKAAAGATADKLKLSKADPAALKDGGKRAANLKASEEDRISKERELRDAKTRQTELERNVKDLQRIAELKNQSLADLQKGAQAKGAQPQVAQGPVVPAAPAVPVKAPEPAKADAPKTAAAPVPAKAPEAPKAAVAPAPVVPAIPAKTPEPPKAAEPAKADAAKAAAPAAAPAPAKAPEPAKAAEAPKAVEAPKAAEPAKAPEPAKAAEVSKVEAPKGDAPKVDAPKVDAPKADAPKVDAKPAAKKAAPPPPPPPEPSLVDEFLGNPLYLGAGGGILALLGGYAAFAVRRKRKEATTGIGSSIISGGDLKANSVFGNTGGQSVDTGNSSFQSDFATPGASAVDSDEVDPVAEADVYMAYGRDAQAEEILKEALQKDPNRQTVRLKLLEIYNQRGDAASFGSIANELHTATGGQGEHWGKAAALGQQLDPGNAMYGGAAAAGGAPAAGATSAADKTMTMPAYGAAAAGTADSLTKTVALDAMQSNAPAGGIDLDFDLGGDAPAAGPAKLDLALDATGAPKPAPLIDFDLGFGDAPAAPAARAAAPDTDFEPGGTLIIDAPPALDSGMAAADKTAELSGMSMAPPPSPSDGGMSIDFDFDLGSSAPAAAPAPAPAPAPAGNSVDFDFGSISLDLPAAAGAAPAALADDVATKLDLAKAYQEMGDKDGAKELLKEVVAEGSAAQKAEAQKLLASIG